ncbi:MAG: hypothetical protein K8963_10890, partial [Proteobacteria bacterium]|nr:hypothetical protein [Pseudomonadota bacterium]
ANWTGGTMTGSGQTTTNGTLSLSGPGRKNLSGGRTLNTASSTTWSEGRIFANGAAINNTSAWLDQTAVDTDIFGPASTFNNSGSYTKSGASTTTIGIAFNNTPAGAGTGVLNVDAGTLNLRGSGTSTGAINLADGTTLNFSGGTYTLDGSVSSAAGARVLIGGGGATVNTVGGKTFDGLLEVATGRLNANDATVVANYLHSGGTLGGTGNVTVSGPANWTGGTMTGAGQTTTNGTLSLSGPGRKDLTGGRTLNAASTTTWSEGRIFASGAAINNTSAWLDQTAVDTDIFGSSSTFNNSGSYTKSGASTTTIGIAFNNTGTTNVQAGAMQTSSA